MVSVCMYFQVHQPYRLRRYQFFDIGKNRDYFDEEKNRAILNKIINKCYMPTNNLLLDLINRFDGRFKVTFSLTGIILEQFENFAPEMIDSFKSLVDTGCVELLNETYHHSLSFIFSKKEFRKQIELHRKKINSLFGFNPNIFRNTELIYSNDLSNFIGKSGHKGILTEGVDRILEWRSPNFVYNSKNSKVRLLLKNYKLSDDIAFRFGEKTWEQHPLTADKFANWINGINGDGNIVNLFMDYETFGEHQWEDKGIFAFLEHMPGQVLNHSDNDFVTPSEAISRYDPVGELDIPYLISWADVERDLSAWIGNNIQREAAKQLYLLESSIIKTGDKKLINDWRMLQTSDHFYYMCTKWFADGDVHKYFNPFESPYEAFISFMNIINDLKIRIRESREVGQMKKDPRLVDVPEDKAFWVSDGTVVKNLKELSRALKKMSPDTFRYHANSEKNDFCNWIASVVGDNELSEELKGIRNKTNAASVVVNRIHEIRSENRAD